MDFALFTHRMHVGLLIAAHVLGVVHVALGRGYMIDPPARASAWREFPGLPINYDDSAIQCGGQMIPAEGHGRCGVCGDPEGMPQDNAAGGRFATGLIVRHYKMGQVITMKVMLTANHLGWFEFKICPNNDVRKPVTLECLDQHVLQRADGLGSRINITTMQTGEYKADYKLPDGMVCSQCVVQWRYHTGNSWGVEPNGKACLGCGSQQECYGCADVSIESAGLPGVQTQAQLVTQPPQIYTPVPTQPPHTLSPLTQDPFLTHTGCHAINLWSGDPAMDKWCVENCAIGRCSAWGCSCGATSTAITQQPTTTSSTTTTTTTTTTPRPTTTSTTTMATTRSTTPSTLPTTPSTLATTPQPNHPPTTYITRVVCKAINLWAGNDYLDRWCSDACARGNCPPDQCKCSEVQQVITLTTTQIYTPMATEPPTTGSPSPSVQYTKVCKAISLWKDINVFDIWCTQNCNNNNVCPAETCVCSDTALFPMTRVASTQMPTTTLPTTPATGCWANSAVSSESAYFNKWCQDNCDRGQCSVDYCICHFK